MHRKKNQRGRKKKSSRRKKGRGKAKKAAVGRVQGEWWKCLFGLVSAMPQHQQVEVLPREPRTCGSSSPGRSSFLLRKTAAESELHDWEW
jgi:hypothetical protein